MYLIHGWMEIVWQKFTKVGQWFTITIAVLLYNIYIYKDRSASHSFTESHQWTCCLPECHRISLKKSTPLKRHICCVLIYNNSPLSVEVKHGFCFVMIFVVTEKQLKKFVMFFSFIVTYVQGHAMTLDCWYYVFIIMILISYVYLARFCVLNGGNDN